MKGWIKGSDCPRQLRLVGNDVVDRPAVYGPEGDHHGFQGIDVPADDALEVNHQMRGHEDRIYCGLGHGSVPPFSFDDYRELIGLSHHRSFHRTDLTRRKRLPEMQAKDGIDPFEGAFLDHLLGSARNSLLGRLEKKNNSSFKPIFPSGHKLSRSHHDSHMPVMGTGMGGFWVFGDVLLVSLLL